MFFPRVLPAVVALLLCLPAAAQEAAPDAAGGPTSRGASDWLSKVTCLVERYGSRMTCTNELGLEIVSCDAGSGAMFKQDGRAGEVDLYTKLGHNCEEQGASQLCLYNKMAWKCGRRHPERYAIEGMTRNCYYIANRGTGNGIFDCRIYDQPTGTKAHLVRCDVGRKNPLDGTRRIDCAPIKKSLASWL